MRATAKKKKAPKGRNVNSGSFMSGECGIYKIKDVIFYIRGIPICQASSSIVSVRGVILTISVTENSCSTFAVSVTPKANDAPTLFSQRGGLNSQRAAISAGAANTPPGEPNGVESHPYNQSWMRSVESLPTATCVPVAVPEPCALPVRVLPGNIF